MLSAYDPDVDRNAADTLNRCLGYAYARCRFCGFATPALDAMGFCENLDACVRRVNAKHSARAA